MGITHGIRAYTLCYIQTWLRWRKKIHLSYRHYVIYVLIPLRENVNNKYTIELLPVTPTRIKQCTLPGVLLCAHVHVYTHIDVINMHALMQCKLCVVLITYVWAWYSVHNNFLIFCVFIRVQQ